MKLVPIPEAVYEEYRQNLMFECYKWDPQFLDNNTVAKYALVLTREEHEKIKELTEKLDKETHKKLIDSSIDELDKIEGSLS